MKKSIIWVLCLFALGVAQLDLSNDESERKKYGMSQAEWEKFRETKMSIDELERLIRCGITFDEYTGRPWLSSGVSAQEWLAERCKGLDDEDIKAFHESTNSDLATIVAFALPGSWHWQQKKYSRAIPLSLAFAASLGCFFAFPDEIEQPPRDVQGAPGTAGQPETIKNYRPVFLVVALADMVLSAVLTYRETSDRHAPVPPDMQEPVTPPTPNPQGSFRLDYRGNHPEIRYVVSF